jgi:thiaminase/transcriptional activator TenA
MRLYAYLGGRLAAGPVDGTYAEWVATYADPGFESLAATLERLLDTYADGDGPAVAYRRAMRLEVAFFDSAYEG